MAHALIFGASGISGWSLANQALHYPTNTTFRTVTALTNRPLDARASKLPLDPRLQLASGIDLTGSLESIVNGLTSKISNINTVSHVFFTAYIEKDDPKELNEVNTRLLTNAVSALDQLSSRLEAVILQTGGKAYGVMFPDKIDFKVPFTEDQPRVPKPEYDSIFYYPQYDSLATLSQGKKWRFYEIRPDVIVGFTPGSNFMNITQGLAIYLSLYRAVHGDGAEVPFVGTQESWKNQHTDTFQDILAQSAIHIALNHDKIKSGSSFNVADGAIVTWEQKWPQIASYFGLKGVGPASQPTDVAGFAKQHNSVWQKLENDHGLKSGVFERYSWGFIDGVCKDFNFDRQYDLSAIRKTGFLEQIPTFKGYAISFDRMRDAKIIP